MSEFPQVTHPKFSISKLAALTSLSALVIAAPALAQQQGQKTFATAQQASDALYAAAKANDEQALLQLLGPDGKSIISSGDQAQDQASRENFAKHYDEMHRLVKEPNGDVTLYIGTYNWPYPIPIVNKDNRWYFDTDAGRQDILFRRIGRNEMSAMRVCEELVAAQKEYSAKHDNTYAQKLVSDPGKQDGLYWQASGNEPQSPIGPLVAEATPNGNGNSAPTPYHGYYFQILTQQGKSAPGGAKSYLAGDKMTGFAFIAYPAEYRSSGVMTFLIGDDGVLYEKDLGKNTATTAKSIKEYDPGHGWHKVENQPQETAGTDSTK